MLSDLPVAKEHIATQQDIGSGLVKLNIDVTIQ